MILALTLNPAIDKVYAVSDFQVDQVFRAEAMTRTAGGKGLNVARVAKLLGEPVISAGFIGGGSGVFIQNQVKAQGITDRFTEIDGESRINIAIVDHKNHTSTEVLEAGPAIQVGDYRKFISNYTKLVQECDIVTASGSLPPGVPPECYQYLITIARQSGKRFILDTSGYPLINAILAKPYMIKPNLEEYLKCFGDENTSTQPLDFSGAILNLADRGIEYPCISLGKDGCIVKIDSSIYHLCPPVLEAVNTVGSGDSFVAGCAVGFSRKWPPLEVFKLGMACGIANTQFFETGKITLPLVEQYGHMIKVEQL
jgi:tagatose 6-phosphate kinase